MLAHAHRQQRDRIVLDIEQRLVVLRPRHRRRRILDFVWEHLAGRQVLDANGELAPSVRVFGVGEQVLVRTDFFSADLEEIVPLRERVGVDQNFLRGVFAAVPDPAKDPVYGADGPLRTLWGASRQVA